VFRQLIIRLTFAVSIQIPARHMWTWWLLLYTCCHHNVQSISKIYCRCE